MQAVFLHALNAIHVSTISGKLSFAILELSFAILDLSFPKIWRFLDENSLKISFFKQILVKIFRKTLFLRGLELSFQAKTEFFKIFGI